MDRTGYETLIASMVDGQAAGEFGIGRPVYAGLGRYAAGLGLTRPPVAGLVNPRGESERIAAGVWDALAAFVTGGPTAVLDRVVAERGESFLTLSPGENPEPYWYHELAVLHAIDAYADLSENRAAAGAVAAVAAFDQAEIQPDHATAEPWGLSAFLKSDHTLPTADSLLHAVRMNRPAGAVGPTFLLLADTLYRLRHVGRHQRR